MKKYAQFDALQTVQRKKNRFSIVVAQWKLLENDHFNFDEKHEPNNVTVISVYFWMWVSECFSNSNASKITAAETKTTTKIYHSVPQHKIAVSMKFQQINS